jgi:hypothetical protein
MEQNFNEQAGCHHTDPSKCATTLPLNVEIRLLSTDAASHPERTQSAYKSYCRDVVYST